MSNMTLSDSYVMLCDWRGSCVWTNEKSLPVQIGDPVWKDGAAKSQEEMKATIGRVIAAREFQEIEVVDRRGNRYRNWIWPLNCPEVAICILGLHLPRNFRKLRNRERECLELLAQGMETRDIADRLDVSLSTVHSHLKHARETLGLPSIEALISFAARFCYPVNRPLNEPAAQKT